MSDKGRLKIAAAVTALFLAAVSAAGVATHTHAFPATTAVTSNVASHAQAQSHPNPIPLSNGQEHD